MNRCHQRRKEELGFLLKTERDGSQLFLIASSSISSICQQTNFQLPIISINFNLLECLNLILNKGSFSNIIFSIFFLNTFKIGY